SNIALIPPVGIGVQSDLASLVRNDTILASETSASTSRDDMSAIVTTAALELAAPASGATISPTSAFFFKTVPSNDATMRVLSTATSASLTANLAASMPATTLL